MGIATPDTDPGSRPKRAGAVYTALALAFFFAVGLAGGAAYKAYFGNAAGAQVADAEQASPPPPPASPETFAADTSSATEKAPSDLARIEPAAEPALTPPPAPTVAEPPESPPEPALAQAASPSQPLAPEPAPQTVEAEPTAAPAAEIASNAEPLPAAQAAELGDLAAPPKLATVAHRPAPRTAMHQPPNARGDTAGSYRVQFGAFAQEDNARRLQSAIEATGLKVEISQAPGPSGNSLFFVRSPTYPDYASALSAARSVQNRAQHLANAIPIAYTIRPGHSPPRPQARR